MNDKTQPHYFNPDIRGLDALLKQTDPSIPPWKKGFIYYPANGLTIVIYGAAGLGKTNLALQMAFAAAKGHQHVKRHKHVIYLTKDTKSEVLFSRISATFNGFQNDDPKIDQKVHGCEWKRRVCGVNFYLLEQKASEAMLKAPKLLEDMFNGSFFAFADFDEVPSNTGKLDRFGMMNSVYDALGSLVPGLKPLFDKMEHLEAQNEGIRNNTDLFIVCDSLSASALEENLRQQNAKYVENRKSFLRKPICLFLMESEVMPQAMTVSFPPDIQIGLATRQESHDVISRTIRLVKTRFQDSLSDRTTYKIRDAISIEDRYKSQPDDKPTPGIEIFPPLSHEDAPLEKRTRKDPVLFGIKELDEFASETGLEAGGFTLLVTDNRCGATPLSLHYLLGQIAQEDKKEPAKEDAIRSVLYISFSDAPGDVMSFIKKSANLKNVLEGDDFDHQPTDHKSRVLYKCKLKRGLKAGGKIRHSYLNVFLPKFEWLTPEQAMSQVINLLQKTASGCEGTCPAKNKPGMPKDPNCGECLRIDRIVLDRVSRLQACWPLVKDAGIFISALVALCKKYKIELMLIDDTATKEENTSLFLSRWGNMAQNIIRLRRVPFHGTETTTIELCSVGGSRSVEQNRPYELGREMDVRDTFRGHTFLPSGEPVRCKVKVELCYDAENTPLYHEVMTMKKSIEAAMDGVEVKVLGRGDWAGINSAFSNLTSGSRDTCHVVAIDGIGLQQLLTDGSQKQVLHSFTSDELMKLLPAHLIKQLGELTASEDETQRLRKIRDAFYEQYVTRSSSIALSIIKANNKKNGNDIRDEAIRLEAYLAAIPMRHNWGVLAVAKLSDALVTKIIKGLFDEQPSGAPNERPGGTADKKPDKSMKHKGWQELCAKLNEQKEGLYAKAQASNITWDAIAEFRVNYWYPFWKGMDLESRIANISKGKNTDPWVLLFPRIDLFGLAITSEESVISFLLELFLAHFEQEKLFHKLHGKNNVKHDVARLQFIPNETAFIEVLYLFYRLLSPRQRRQLSIGTGAAHEAIGSGLAEQVYGGGEGENPFKAWPKQICLLSRQWISTVQDLMPRYDVRESMEMFPLPAGRQEASQAWWEEFELHKDNKPTYLQAWDKILTTGVPVAGTWYLGVLNGGNIDLAPDVMKPILSKEQEQDRLLTHSGAPVSRAVYGEHNPQLDKDNTGLKRSHRFPYADVMRRVKKHEESKGKSELIYFPFHRTQIHDYSQVSRILYNLVRNVMSIKVDDDRCLANEPDKVKIDKEDEKPLKKQWPKTQKELLSEIGWQVQRSFRRMNEIDALWKPKNNTERQSKQKNTNANR